MKYILLILSALCINFLYAQPKETIAGRYEDHGFWREHPYTMFNKRKGNWNLQEELTKIRKLIYEGQPDSTAKETFKNIYAQLYKGIYEDAKKLEPNSFGYDDLKETSPHPAWVKNNALVYLIGISFNKSNNTFDSIVDVNLKNKFKDNAIYGLRKMNTYVVSCYGGDDCSKLLNRGQELIEYAQAYDILKSTDALAYDDRNEGNSSCRNQLRIFTRNFYRQSSSVINSTAGWKKNHGIIACCALGTAALVLNDAGVSNDFLDEVWGIILATYCS